MVESIGCGAEVPSLCGWLTVNQLQCGWEVYLHPLGNHQQKCCLEMSGGWKVDQHTVMPVWLIDAVFLGYKTNVSYSQQKHPSSDESCCLKADNKDSGLKVPRSLVSLAGLGVVHVQICWQTSDGDDDCSCSYLCVLFLELLWAPSGDASPGAEWKPLHSAGAG